MHQQEIKRFLYILFLVAIGSGVGGIWSCQAALDAEQDEKQREAVTTNAILRAARAAPETSTIDPRRMPTHRLTVGEQVALVKVAMLDPAVRSSLATNDIPGLLAVVSSIQESGGKDPEQYFSEPNPRALLVVTRLANVDSAELQNIGQVAANHGLLAVLRHEGQPAFLPVQSGHDFWDPWRWLWCWLGAGVVILFFQVVLELGDTSIHAFVQGLPWKNLLFLLSMLVSGPLPVGLALGYGALRLLGEPSLLLLPFRGVFRRVLAKVRPEKALMMTHPRWVLLRPQNGVDQLALLRAAGIPTLDIATGRQAKTLGCAVPETAAAAARERLGLQQGDGEEFEPGKVFC
jgi:hypothetical protein